MKKVEYGCVWDAVADTPVEAENLRLRSELMALLSAYIRESGMTQDEAARLFGVTQPRISDLMRGKIDRFTVDSLAAMATVGGLRVEVRILEAA